jgi:hypothetical protein
MKRSQFERSLVEYFRVQELGMSPSQAERAVALVVEGIESLDPENVTGETVRDAVVDVLVRAQMMPEYSRK